MNTRGINRGASKRGLCLAITLIYLLITALAPFQVLAQPAGGASAQYVNTAVDHTTYGWVLTPASKNADGTVSVEIMEAPGFTAKQYTTAVPLNTGEHASPATGTTRADALPVVLTKNAFAEIRFNSSGQCIDMEVVEYGTATNLDSASYGGELTAKGGGAGNMVAQGWILDKDAGQNTVTIGDGNHYTNIFEQTYTLADDVAIYVVDNPSSRNSTTFNSDGTWDLVRKGGFEDITVTERQEDGEIYYTPERWTALCIFDSNYQTSWQDGQAKVKELYLYSKPTTMAEADMFTPDGMQYAGTSWYPLKMRGEEETTYNYGGSADPIEFMKGRLYAVGDNYTSVMLYVGDDGTTSLMDMGNPTTRYQYYLNVEKVGYDPREIDNIFLTHGHFDHYAAMYEFSAMIRRAGNTNYRGWINEYAKDGGTFVSETGNTYSMSGTLGDQSVLYAADSVMKWHEWVDILGPGADLYIWPAMGHSTDTASFVFKMTATADDAYFEEGEVVSYLYFGGYAVQAGTRAGAMRLALVNSLQYQQSVIAQWADAQSDYIYPLCQHTNQVSMLEIDKACRIAGIPFMAGYVGGLEEVGNYCENRIANMLYQSYNDAFEDNYSDNLSQILRDAGLNVPDLDFDLLPHADGDVYVQGTRGTKKLDTIEEHGPYKRADDEYEITVKGVQVVHGYDAFMNKQPLFADQTNLYGFSLDEGFVILWDTYTHDPDGWFVQILAEVHDDYDGGVDYATNRYTPFGYTTNQNGLGDQPVVWTSGPVELCNPAQGAYEFLRMPRFDTQEEAEAFAKALTGGGYAEPYILYNVDGSEMYQYDSTANRELDDYGAAPVNTATYTVNLDRMSHVVLGDSFEETFRPASGKTVSLTTDAHNVQAGDFVPVTVSFHEEQPANTVVLNFTFDAEKFRYNGYSVNDVDNVTLVDYQSGEGWAKITLMAPNYDAKELGYLGLVAKENAPLVRERQWVNVTAEYVLRDDAGDKSVAEAKTKVSFTTLGDGEGGPGLPGDTNDDGVVDILDLSNIIDWFGYKPENQAGWDNWYAFFDYNNNGEIDISDIVFVARLL